MSNPGPDTPEQYIITLRTVAGREYRRCIDAYGITDLTEWVKVEERVHGSRFIAIELLE